MGKVCAFFGHRDAREELDHRLEQAVRAAITEQDCSVFWVGGYGLFDSMAAAAVRRLKEEFPRIRLSLVLAYLPTEATAPLGKYDNTIYPEGLELVPRRFAISRRNQWIVNNCDVVIGYVNCSFGGAHTACRAAARRGKLMANLGSLAL